MILFWITAVQGFSEPAVDLLMVLPVVAVLSLHWHNFAAAKVGLYEVVPSVGWTDPAAEVDVVAGQFVVEIEAAVHVGSRALGAFVDPDNPYFGILNTDFAEG